MFDESVAKQAVSEGAKQVEGFSNYFIYPDGRLLSMASKKPIFKKPSFAGYGYEQHTLYQDFKYKRYYTHRLVAKYFLPKNENPKLQINHIDGDKLNNHFTNLEWITASQNQRARIKQGNYHYRGGFCKPSLTPSDVKEIRQLISEQINTKEIAKKYNVGRECISKIANGKRWAWVE